MTRDEAKRHIEDTCGKGWLTLLDKVFDNPPPGLVVAEVFQKYGKLEFRLDPWDSRFDSYLSDIRFESSLICDICGAAGSGKIIAGWIVTICNRHFLGQSNEG